MKKKKLRKKKNLNEKEKLKMFFFSTRTLIRWCPNTFHRQIHWVNDTWWWWSPSAISL